MVNLRPAVELRKLSDEILIDDLLHDEAFLEKLIELDIMPLYHLLNKWYALQIEKNMGYRE